MTYRDKCWVSQSKRGMGVLVGSAAVGNTWLGGKPLKGVASGKRARDGRVDMCILFLGDGSSDGV